MADQYHTDTIFVKNVFEQFKNGTGKCWQISLVKWKQKYKAFQTAWKNVPMKLQMRQKILAVWLEQFLI